MLLSSPQRTAAALPDVLMAPGPATIRGSYRNQFDHQTFDYRTDYRRGLTQSGAAQLAGPLTTLAFSAARRTSVALADVGRNAKRTSRKHRRSRETHERVARRLQP